MKKMHKIIIGILVLFILSSASIAIAANIDSKNQKYSSLLEEIYSNITGKGKGVGSDNIVAYLNESPIYNAEIIVRKEATKIAANEQMATTETDSSIIDRMKSNMEKSDEDIIKDIAKERLLIAEAERQSITISDDDVKKAQSSKKKSRETKADNGDKAVIEGNKKYQELYKKLGVSEEEFYDNYDFIIGKGALIELKYVQSEYFKEYVNQERQKGVSDSLTTILDNYLNDLLNRSDFRLVK